MSKNNYIPRIVQNTSYQNRIDDLNKAIGAALNVIEKIILAASTEEVYKLAIKAKKILTDA